MNYFDWKKALLNYYKSLELTENDVMIIYLIAFLIENEECLVTPDLIALKATLKYEVIDDILDSLMQKKYVTTISKDGKIITSLESLKRILFELYLLDENNAKKSNQEKQTEILKMIEQTFARPLSFIEVNMINEWLIDGYSKEIILFALKEAISRKIKSINYIDKILLEWKKQEERRNEGYTTITDNWKKDISESNKITDLNWIGKKDV
ncbi:MAG: DnaD domain protein [Bacilli bacterium]|nr:DnaD domain protein [Bacilli bacterium]